MVHVAAKLPKFAATSLAVILTFTMAACSTEEAQGEVPSVGALAATVAEAKAAGADPAQIALFEDGAIDYADYESAINAYASCAQDAGLTVSVGGTFMSQGVTLLSYSVDVSGQNDEALMNDCYQSQAQFVDQYWQTESPDAIAFNERRAAALLPQLQTCLTGYGVDFPQDAAFDELTDLAIDHLLVNDSENCMSDIGYMTWQG